MKREEFTKATVEGLLQKTGRKLSFGGTLMGIVRLKGVGQVAIGRRNIPKTKPELFHILELLGPVSIDEAKEMGDASYQLEYLLDKAELMGVSDRVEAIVADSQIVFGLFAEGLIVDDNLKAAIKGYAEGRVILNGWTYKLLAFSGSGVLGLGNNAVLVDKKMCPVP